MKKVLILLLAISTILSCNSKEVLAKEDFNEIETDNLFKLSIPKYMKVMTNLND